MAIEPKHLRPMPQPFREAIEVVIAEMQGVVSKLLLYYSPTIDAGKLYEMLIPTGDYPTMLAASMLMPKATRYDSVTVGLNVQGDPSYPDEKFPFTLIYHNRNTDRTQWLFPQFMQTVTPGSEFGRNLIQVVDLAIQCKTTMELLKMMLTQCNNPALIVYMLPCIKLLVPRALHSYRGSDARDMKMRDNIKRLLTTPTPSYVPPTSSYFTNACGYGTSLVSIWAMVEKEAEDRMNGRQGEGLVTVLPFQNDAYVEDGIREHFNDFCRVMWPPETLEEKAKREERANKWIGQD